MPIQIPELKRMNAPEDASVGRLENNIVNPAPAISQVSQAAEHLGAETLDFANRMQLQAHEAVAQKADLDFELWHQKEMDGDPATGKVGIRFQNGDPTVMYNQLDKDTTAKIEELSNNPDWAPALSSMVAKRLTSRLGQLQMKTLTVYGEQQKRYDDSYTDAITKLHQRNLIDTTVHIVPGDSSTLVPFNDAIADIRDPILKQGMRYHTVNPVGPDEKGNSFYIGDDGKPVNVKVDPATQEQIAKALGEGVYHSIDNLIKDGKPEALKTAKYLQDQYGDYVDAFKKGQLQDNMAKAEFTNTAFDLADKARRIGLSAALKGTSDPQMKAQVLKLTNEQQSEAHAMKERASKDNFDLAMNHVDQVMDSDKPYGGSVTMQSDQFIKNILPNITDAKQREALLARADVRPKESKPAAREKMLNIMANDVASGFADGYKGMSPATFNLYSTGLNDTDYNDAKKHWKEVNTENGAQRNDKYRQAVTKLNAALIANGVITPNRFTNRITGQDQQIQYAAQRSMTRDLDQRGPMTPKEVDDFVADKAAQIKLGKAMPAVPARSWKATGPVFGNGTPLTDTPTTYQLDQSDKERWKNKFIKKNGRAPSPITGELDKFIKENGG